MRTFEHVTHVLSDRHGSPYRLPHGHVRLFVNFVNYVQALGIRK